MKLLGYCLLCLFATRVQPKPQVTKLFPEGLAPYHKQFNSTTQSVDKFWDKLRTTYKLVFRQLGNTSDAEKVLAKNAPDTNLQALRLIWADTLKADNYTNLKYPSNSFLDQVKSLSILKKNDSKAKASNLEGSTFEIKATSENRTNVTSSSNKIKSLPDDDWFNDIQPLGQLELQDDELDKKNEVEIVKTGTTTAVYHLLEWLGSLFGFTYSVYSKLSGVACGNEKAIR
ncbi:PREDICTED: uncharacterized protein LOC105559445 [Vollenhovia emeryi]|uniref:uncharacterized protein LOC105559445 n=1 Tax=Vollenhovia emeryi TaxID=411798 RepID=UPI0005F48AE6|nr:PREDICTED: uncharacterized protein LOC105559445 [Vollenhovia emeryi]